MSPNSTRELSFSEERGDCLFECAIFALCDPILLRCVRGRVLVHDPMFLHEVVPLVSDVLAALVVSEALDLVASLVLRERLVVLECFECIRLVLKRVGDGVAGVDVRERHPVPAAFVCFCDWAMEIRDDDLERRGCDGCGVREWVPVLLSSDTRLTDVVEWRVVLDDDTNC